MTYIVAVLSGNRYRDYAIADIGDYLFDLPVKKEYDFRRKEGDYGFFGII